MQSNNQDSLKRIFEMRSSFMNSLESAKPGSYPPWPLNISSKQSQQVLRETALKGIEEMFEALQHLKNWKPHRDTEVSEFNHEEFLEEVVDAFNYFISVLVLVGVTEGEFFEAYEKKDKIIRNRLLNGY